MCYEKKYRLMSFPETHPASADLQSVPTEGSVEILPDTNDQKKIYPDLIFTLLFIGK